MYYYVNNLKIRRGAGPLRKRKGSQAVLKTTMEFKRIKEFNNLMKLKDDDTAEN